ncbi:UDP-N-acetylmuramate dehydrogenase [Marivirga arenosa]|uniref:UDP-N-acetylenolpyruvoylglucosamine reductase n=1 Tax=Marivirga arenosa TaxID=3059076 RepID=A0AA51N6G5_9BACT|nr:UDP-N-acetylmuramate dehydrogenase [Marivirga sp. ABR2-2]WMN06505.1 UDP-N-acetylmuramate dehydrogenase [Marivirga sp. ABR2-2]
MLNFLKSESLRSYNTFGFSAVADLLIEINTIEEFQLLLESKEWKENSHLILGGGSNILLTDDFHGLVVINKISGIKKVAEDDETVTVKVGGGVNWHEFVLFTINNDWGGLENLSLIPGTVGAAPMQNIGAYGIEIKDTFENLEAVNLESGEIESFNTDACKFGYRESVFKHKLKGKYLIVSVSFRLHKKNFHKLSLEYGVIRDVLEQRDINKPSIKDVSNAVIEIRESKLPNPAEIGNSGSFFKNPIIDSFQFEALKEQYPSIPSYELESGQIKLAAGWLIEKAGWKGYEENGVGVHHKQALVLVNHGQGRGRDILNLAKKIQSSIQSKFGIELSPEVNFI